MKIRSEKLNPLETRSLLKSMPVHSVRLHETNIKRVSNVRYILKNQVLIVLVSYFSPSLSILWTPFDSYQSLNRLSYELNLRKYGMSFSGFHHQIMSGSLMRLK